MKVLILGSGGREHTLAWKVAQSPLLKKLYIAPGNAGTLELGTNVDIGVEDFDAIRSFVIKENIDMVVVGPEAPLVKGIVDAGGRVMEVTEQRHSLEDVYLSLVREEEAA